ncbi:MAG: exosortase A [Sphingomonadales bacterium]
MAAARYSGPRRGWRLAMVVFGAAAACLLALFWPTAVSMEQIWRTNDSYQHTYLAPLILAWLVWDDRDRLARETPAADWRGAGIVLAASLVWLLGWAAQVQVVQQLAVIGMVQGLAFAVFGWRVVRLLWFPLLFMVFLVPMGDFMVPILQRWTADVVVWTVRLTGIPTVTDGFMITLEGGAEAWQRFHVARECSGIRYLTAMFQIGLLTAWLFYRSWPRRAAAVLAALAVPILANWIRAVGIVLIVYHTEGERGMDVDHLIYGFWFFLFVLAVYIGVCWLFAEAPPRRMHVAGAGVPAAPGEARRLFAAAALALLAAAPGPLYAAVLDGGPDDAPPASGSRLPGEVDGWRRTAYQGLDWRPVYPGAQDEVLARYVRGADVVDLYVGRYRAQRQGAELVSWANSLAGDGWEDLGERLPATLMVDGGPLHVRYVRLAQHGRQRIVFYWYRVNGGNVSSDMMAKVGLTWSRLISADPASAVIAVAGDGGDLSEATARAEAFLTVMPRPERLAEVR